MSEPMRTTVTCPKCHKPGEAEIWTTVNSAKDPDEAQWLIDGFLFQYECPACGHLSALNHDCLFNDVAHRTFIMYVADPKKAADALVELEARTEDDYHVRLVESREALREKAAILRDGLDDRAIEVAKQAVFTKFVESGEIPRDARAYYGALAEDGGIIIEFVAKGTSCETTIPRSVYDGIADSFTDLQPSIVNREWASKILETWE